MGATHEMLMSQYETAFRRLGIATLALD